MVSAEMEKAFGETTKLLLGESLQGIDNYSKWLGNRVPLPHLSKSVVSGKEVWIPPALNFLNIEFDKSKTISMEEMDKVNVSPFTLKDLEGADIGQIVSKILPPVTYNTGNFRYQTNENVEKSSGAGGGRNLYYCEDVYLGVKNIGFANYTLHSENIFGAHGVSHSAFSIHVYNSTALSRCFEVDASSNSSDLLFCHNCENVHDSMFTFNAKNLRYAIGNVQLPMEKYKEIKQKILAELVKEIKEKKDIGFDIYNLRR